MTDHVTLRLHTGGLNLNNYVTSEGKSRLFIVGVETGVLWVLFNEAAS